MLDDWVPRSQRLGLGDYDGPFDGVPDHLYGPLVDWLVSAFHPQGRGSEWRAAEMRAVALRLRLMVDHESTSASLFRDIVRQCADDTDTFLDLVEGALRTGVSATLTQQLRDLLSLGGHELTVSPDGVSLTEVVSVEAASMASSAIASADEAAGELAEAWTHAYGRDPDPSDAWVHAIKAIESVLQPAVCPNDHTATLGKIIGNLERSGWKTIFPGAKKDGDINNLVAALRLIWPNPDRHAPVKRRPTLEEARAVVNLAVALVQSHRDGPLVFK